jgi:triphosphoribosyl-dephospho-CoA synthase
MTTAPQRTAASEAAFIAAFVAACDLDVAARKPGNVSHASPGHRMTAALFERSARVAAPALAQTGAGIGARIEAAMRATLAEVACNTNLGIVLLAAPLALACERQAPGETLRAALARVLAATTLDDAAAAFRAIALTQPAGLGTVAEQDVARAPTQVWRQAMALAAGRDRIAGLHVPAQVPRLAGLPATVQPLGGGVYAEIFELGLPAWHQCAAQGASREACMVAAWLALLAAAPDTHIVRKQGMAAAHSVMNEAQAWWQRVARGEAVWADPAWVAWDEALKAAGLNPGTCADLAVGTALLAGLLRAPAGRPGAITTGRQRPADKA